MKIRLAEILDEMRFTDWVTLKTTNGEVLITEEWEIVKLSKYRPWWVIDVVFSPGSMASTVVENESELEKVVASSNRKEVNHEDDLKLYFKGTDTPPDIQTLRKFEKTLKMIDIINN